MPLIELLSDTEDFNEDENNDIIDLKPTQQSQNPALIVNLEDELDNEPLITISKQTVTETLVDQIEEDEPQITDDKLEESEITESSEDSIIHELRSRPSPTRFIQLIQQFEALSNGKKRTSSSLYLDLLSTVLIINLPDLYTQLNEKDLPTVHRIFTSLTGLSSITSHIKTYLQQFMSEESANTSAQRSSLDSPSSFLVDPMQRQKLQTTGQEIRKVNTTYTKVSETLQTTYQQISLLLNLLSGILRQSSAVIKLFSQAQGEISETRRITAQKEVVAYLAGSRIYTLSAQCLTVFKQHPLINMETDEEDSSNTNESTRWKWMGSPEEYVRFLGFSLRYILSKASTDTKRLEINLTDSSFLPDFVMKAIRLHGPLYSTKLLSSVIDPKNPELAKSFATNVLFHLRPLDLRNILATHIIPFINKEYLSTAEFISEVEADNFISQEFAKEKIRDCAGLLLLLVSDVVSQKYSETKDNNHRKLILESITSQIPEIATSPSYSTSLRRVLALFLSNLFTSEQERRWEQDQFLELLSNWGKSLNIRHLPIIAQQSQTEFIILWALQLANLKGNNKDIGKCFIRERVITSSAFMNGISNRLNSNSIRPRICGMAVGEVLTKLGSENADDVLSFGMDDAYGQDLDFFRRTMTGFEDEIGNINEWWKSLLTLPEAIQRTHNTKKKTTTVKEPKSTQLEKLSEASNRDVYDDDSDDEFKPIGFETKHHDSDYDDEDLDDPSLNVLDKEKRSLRKPVYIKDLISYLVDSESYDKQKLGLECAASLIQQKATFGQELKFFSKDLAAALIGLRDSFEIKRFDKMREEAVSILVASDYLNVAPYLCSLLVTRDFSNLQRTVILAGLATGAQILAKYGHDALKQSKGTIFPSKMLPSADFHQKFMQLDRLLYGNEIKNTIGQESLTESEEVYNFAHLKAMSVEMQQELLGGTAERAKEQLIGDSKVLRVSSSLEKKRAVSKGDFRATPQGPKQNIYAKVAHRTFFMPLVTQWYRISRQPHMDFTGANGQRRIPGGTEYYGIFVSRFLTTLAMLLYLAAPTSTELVDMSGVLLEIVMEQRRIGSGSNKKQGDGNKSDDLDEERVFYDELSFREGIYTAVLSIVQVNNELDGGESLISRWPREVVELKMWVEELWNNYDQYDYNRGDKSNLSTDPNSLESVIDVESRRVRGLAANILFLLEEIVNKWQRRLITNVMSIENEGLERGMNGVGATLGGTLKVGTSSKIRII